MLKKSNNGSTVSPKKANAATSRKNPKKKKPSVLEWTLSPNDGGYDHHLYDYPRTVSIDNYLYREIQMNQISSDTALLLIDVQKGFDDSGWGSRNNPDTEKRIQQLLETWREKERPIIHVQHMSRNGESPLHPNQSGNEFKTKTAPKVDEPVFQKEVNSAFIGTNLETHLHDKEIQSIVITGLTTNHCISTTTRMAENLGFSPTVVTDATAAFEQEGIGGQNHSAATVHEVALANLQGEFAAIMTTDEVQSDTIQ